MVIVYYCLCENKWFKSSPLVMLFCEASEHAVVEYHPERDDAEREKTHEEHQRHGSEHIDDLSKGH